MRTPFTPAPQLGVSKSQIPPLYRPFTELCKVSVPADLGATVQVMLLDPAGRVLVAAMGFNSTEAIFFLASLRESDQGEYRCRSIVSSDWLSNPVVAEKTFPVQASPGGYHTCIVKCSAISSLILSLSLSLSSCSALCG